jgi:hypothetical protein
MTAILEAIPPLPANATEVLEYFIKYQFFMTEYQFSQNQCQFFFWQTL